MGVVWGGRIRLITVSLPCRSLPARIPSGPGDFVVLTTPFTFLRRRLRRVLWDATVARPDVDLFYGFDGVPFGPQPVAKPAASFMLLAAYDSIGLPLVIRGAALAALGGLRPEFGLSAAYDIGLRALSCGLVAQQLPLHFAHVMAPAIGRAAVRRAVLEHWNAETGAPWRISPGARPGTLQVRRAFATPPRVSVIVQPAPDGANRLAPTLAALARGAWPAEGVEVLADSRLDTAGAEAGPIRWRKVDTAADACEAGRRNALWQAAQSELILFLDAGLEPERADWIDALAGLAADPTVGMVSGRVLADGRDRPDAAAALFGFSPRTWPEQGYVHREFAVPISPLIATRRSNLEAVNGFAPGLPAAFLAADAALRMRLLGLSVLATPFAQAQGPEAGAAPEAEPGAFLGRWEKVRDADRLSFPDAPLAGPR